MEIQTEAQLDKFKAAVAAGVEAQRKLAQVVNDTVFSFGELAYQEFESSKYLTSILEKNNFTVERGIAGIPTAWVARWGSGRPLIGLGSDLDCIPKASQKPGIAFREPLVKDAPGHGEGHNSGHAVVIVAALAVKELMERENLPGTLMIWPGVAEELLGGKAFFVREGLFNGVDVVLHTHVHDQFATEWGSPNRSTGMVSVEYTFEGEAAHAASAPERGRNALRAVELMNAGWDSRREHLRPEQRSHYVITNGGDQPNVVPALASVWYYVRETDFANIKKNFEIANKIAAAAASMTDTKVTRKLIGTAAPRHFNKALAEALQSNIVKAGMPAWTNDEQTFAKAVQHLTGGKEDGLRTETSELQSPPPKPEGGSSDDIGDVCWSVPTVLMRYPANIPNLPGHHWANAIAMATPIAHKGIVAGSKALAMMLVDLLLRPELIASAKDYFTNVQLHNTAVIKFLEPADQPQTHLNSDIMARFRPEMRKFYYDASRYDTYLEQLGITFPTLTKV